MCKPHKEDSIDFRTLVFTCLYDTHHQAAMNERGYSGRTHTHCITRTHKHTEEKGCPLCFSCQGRFTLLSGWGWIRKGCDFLVNFTMNKTLLILLEINFDHFWTLRQDKNEF